MLKTSFEYELKSPVLYTDNGERVEGSLLVVYAPAFKHRVLSRKLKQIFVRVLKEYQDNLDKKSSSKKSNKSDRNDDSEGDAKAWVLLLYSSDIDASEIFDAFEQLILLPGLVKIEDKANLQRSHLEQMVPEDLENLLGEYAENFLSQSL